MVIKTGVKRHENSRRTSKNEGDRPHPSEWE